MLDVNSEYLGTPREILMENAGKAVAELVEGSFGRGNRVAIVCGTGNNGGDGFVAARYLRERNKVQVLLARPRQSIGTDLARRNFERVADISSPAADADLKAFAIIVDALFGTGFSGRIEEPYKSLIERMNSSGAKVVSVDVPSGLGTRAAVKPRLTVTFHDVKEGMTRRNSGKIVVSDIGIPKEAERYVGPGELAYYPIPDRDSRKGQNGEVLIVKGGPYTGAPALAGLAAYRIGVDLVHIATPSVSFVPIASFSPNLVVHSLAGDRIVGSDLEALRDLCERADAVLVGSGAGDHNTTREALRELVRRCDRPLVVDADCIAAVAEDLAVLSGKEGVITPHAAELASLTGRETPNDTEGRCEETETLAKTTGMTVLLKGRIDVVSDGKRTKLNRTGNAAMSVGGTGDVLAGAVAGLMAKGMRPYDSARVAAFTCGYAGDLAFEDLGYGLMATDVVDRIPAVLKRFLAKLI